MVCTVTMAMIVLLFTTLAVGPALAQTPSPMSLDEIAESYSHGDRIVISGSVTRIAGLDQVTLKISTGNEITSLAQLDVARDGSFATILNTDGGVWKAGTYTATVTYHEDTSRSIDFEIRGGGAVTQDIFTVDIGDGETRDIGYSITGGVVREMEIDADMLSLVVRIDATSAGSITMNIDREYIDSRTMMCEGDDEDFIVLIDNTQIPYIKSASDANMRTIEVAFESEESKIEIIGTCAIPEFGAVAMIVLAASITGVVAASRRLAA